MDIDIETLINVVQANPVLWDKSNSSHHNALILNSTWKNVARIMNMEGEESKLQKKWKALREAFRTNLLNQTKDMRSGSGAKKQITWPYFNQMLFLKDILMARPMDSNLKNPSEQIGETQEEETKTIKKPPSNTSAGSGSTSSLAGGSPGSYSGSASSSKKFSPNTNTMNFTKQRNSDKKDFGMELVSLEKRKLALAEAQAEQQSKKQCPSPPLEKNDDMLFFESLIPLLKGMNAHAKLTYRTKILNFTQECLPPPPKEMPPSRKATPPLRNTTPPPPKEEYEYMYVDLSDVEAEEGLHKSSLDGIDNVRIV